MTLEDVESYAQAQRRLWGMKDGPISNLGVFLENNAVIWARCPLPKSADGVSNWRYQDAFILIKNSPSAYRDRFSLAHELGHLVLHRFLTEQHLLSNKTYQLIEEQANRFAGAFLFPATSFAKEIRYLKLDYLLAVKERWKISCQALVSRGSQLGLFSDDQVQYFYFNLIKRTGSRTKEPGDEKLAREFPCLFLEASSVPFLNVQEILDASGLSIQDFSSITAIPEALLLNPRIIVFKPSV